MYSSGWILVGLIAVFAVFCSKNSQFMPKTKKVEVVDDIHGTKVSDPYRWLEENTSPEVQTWVDEQNVYTRSFIDKINSRDAIKTRMRELFSLDTVAVPYPKNGKYFFVERKGGQDLGVLYVQDGLQALPRVLIDQNTLSSDKKTVLSEWNPSEDGRLLAYGLSKASNDRESIKVLNVDSGKDLPDEIPETGYPSFGSWSADGTGFWYIRRDPNAPENSEEKFYKRIFYHKLGDDPKSDVVVFGDGREKTDYLSAQASKDGRWLLISVYVTTGEKPRNELYLKDLLDPASVFMTVVKGKDAIFGAIFHRGNLYILTNHEAPNWKIMFVTMEKASEGSHQWITVIPEGKAVIETFLTVKDRFFVQTLENVHSVLREYYLDGSLRGEIPLPSLGTLSGITGEEEGNEIFFGFTSFVIPHNVYRLQLGRSMPSLFKKAEGGIQDSDFQVEQEWYPSKDGTKIPMFIVSKKGLKRNGKNPVMLYGYGGFNISITPSFAKTTIPFLEAGGIYVEANLRGGSEFGEKWHEAGMRKNKQNVFDDFIAAAEFLIAKKYTSNNKLAIFGWSNGGLLTGACLNQRPDLYKAVVIGNPVLDMLRYHLFDGGRLWIPDYGSAEEPDMVPYLLSYSPYHNVKNGTKYPATLILTSDSDDRVHPGQAYKTAARLQEVNASKNPILLRVETKAGHGGAAAISATIEQYADIWSFVFWQLGVKN
ncbi:MAG: prolyl oligopeptidase family serine peptidase [Candidatus Taylorbacteria bacterium]|nr:prolyl oligopeptidase family serine peptidase [Candidatus Taylorbacteria bacterium]